MNFSSCSDDSWIITTAIFSSLTFEFEYFFFSELLSLQHKTLILWYTLPSLWTTEWKSKKAKRERERAKYQDLARELKTWWSQRYQLQLAHLERSSKDWKVRVERVGNQRTNRHHPDNSISLNTKKSPGDLRRLAITETPVKDHQLQLVGKTLRGLYNYNNI